MVPRRSSYFDLDCVGETFSSVEIHRLLIEVHGDGIREVQRNRKWAEISELSY